MVSISSSETSLAPSATTRRQLKNNPENLDAWEGFLLASNQAGRAGLALKTLESLPVSVHEAAQQRPGFLSRRGC